MANFKFKLLTSADPQAQYDAIAVKDSLTFYLLNTGVGYLGDIKMFDANADIGIGNLVTNMLSEGFVADDVTVASTKAIVDYVTDKINNVSTVLTTSFFRHVESHVLTQDDLDNPAVSVPEGTEVGVIGLLFTADTDNEEGGESYYFIPLTNYLENIYLPEDSSSIKMSISAENKIKAELKIKEGEESIKVDEENGGVYIDKVTEINDETPSASKLVTEAAVAEYVKQAISDLVSYAIDDGTTTS